MSHPQRQPRSQPAIVGGFTAAGYEGVRRVFAANFTERGDLGASFAVHDGERFVVDLWGGSADEHGRAWHSDTLCLTYSVTKGLVTVLVARLVDSGLLTLDDRVQRYWPEFAVGGKEATTVRMLLAHRAGLPTIEPGLTLDELLQPGAAASRLAQQAPQWVPGETFGYHALTWGWLVDEILYRVTGEHIPKLLRHEVAEPLGVEAYIGLPGDVFSRVADLSTCPNSGIAAGVHPDRPDASLVTRIDDPYLRAQLEANMADVERREDLFEQTITAGGLLPIMDPTTWNSDAVRKAIIPAANAITNARAVARIYGSLTETGTGAFVTRSTLDDLSGEQSAGVDQITGFTSRFGTGFMLPTPGNPMYSDASFGHEGVGGAQGFVDLDERLGFGFVQNRLHQVAGGDARLAALVEAVRQARR